jgi:DNA polymerase III alpha subunit
MSEEYKLRDVTNGFVRKVPKSDEYRDRLLRELKLIRDRKFIKVFMQVKTILQLTSDIPHVIRGSAGSSLVCYLMGITDVDPVYYNISLARFMHEDRADNPDIDIDFPYNKRTEVFKRIYDHFGKHRVARISNHLYFREKSALREAVRSQGYRKQYSKHDDLVELLGEEKVQKVVDTARDLYKTFRGYSLHCGGIVIFDNKIPEKLILKGNQIKLNKDQVEERGLIKIDILSNRALAQLADLDNNSLATYPEYDDLTSELLSAGNNMGITIAESPAMRKIFTSMKPKSRMDVAFALALLRPAAAAEGNKDKILNGHDPVLVFDDDAIDKIQDILGCSEAEADNYRRAFAKHKEDKIEELLSRISNQEDKDLILGNFRRLSLYSFSKSHAIAYGQLVWALAYQKARKPQEFWLTALNHCQSMYNKWVFYRHAVASGLTITLGKGPWRLEDGVILGDKAEQSGGQIVDYHNYGYWITDKFIGGCYYEEEQADDGRVYVKFRGLVATYRRYTGERKNVKSETASKTYQVTFVTVGYDNDKMLDLVLYGRPKVGKLNIVEGYGIKKVWCNTSHIQVTKYWLSNP